MSAQADGAADLSAGMTGGRSGDLAKQPAQRLVIEMAGVSKAYPPNNAPVLSDLNLELRSGESLALVGRSGSGKTTLLNLVAGLVAPDSGRVVVAGKDLAVLSENERAVFRRSHLGIVFQAFNLLPTLTVKENLQFPLALGGPALRRSGTDNAQYLDELLNALGLTDLADRLPADLSGGEQQRVAVARALIHRPALVLADEPTGNLDLDNAHRVIELLVSQCRQRGAALVLITHSSELSAQMDNTLSIANGALAPISG
ncbi:MAG: ABC transporter ATP-binding protein [Lysobacterales bacterium]